MLLNRHPNASWSSPDWLKGLKRGLIAVLGLFGPLQNGLYCLNGGLRIVDKLKVPRWLLRGLKGLKALIALLGLHSHPQGKPNGRLGGLIAIPGVPCYPWRGLMGLKGGFIAISRRALSILKGLNNHPRTFWSSPGPNGQKRGLKAILGF